MTIGENGIPIWSMPTVSVGSIFGGGKVVYIFQPGDEEYVAGETHGYIAAVNNQSYTQFGCLQTFSGVSSNTATSSGLVNTPIIISNCIESSAATFCNDININGYSDWFLPGQYELLNIDSDLINSTWIACDVDLDFAWYYNGSGGFNTASKSTYKTVIPFRKF